ncbi:MAG: hypothetical protein FWC07_06310, partial [Defluviitaleaceae bacterium]|nr:hypothetical protein [Defluviitaleaceae bacterium]
PLRCASSRLPCLADTVLRCGGPFPFYSAIQLHTQLLPPAGVSLGKWLAVIPRGCGGAGFPCGKPKEVQAWQ